MTRRVSLVVGAVGVLLAGTASQGRAQSGIPVEAAGASLAVELCFLDHAGTPQARETVALRITADGAVWIPGDDGRTLMVADRLRPQQLQDLIEEVLQQGGLARIEGRRLQEMLEQACRSAGLSTRVEGAGATIIRVAGPQGRSEVQIDALSLMAARFPDLAEVQRLFHVQLRLQNVAAVARAGGEQACLPLVELANRTFRQLHPDQPPLTTRDLTMVRRLDTGSRYVQFYRRPGPGGEELLVSLFEIPGQPPNVSVLELPPGESPPHLR